MKVLPISDQFKKKLELLEKTDSDKIIKLISDIPSFDNNQLRKLLFTHVIGELGCRVLKLGNLKLHFTIKKISTNDGIDEFINFIDITKEA